METNIFGALINIKKYHSNDLNKIITPRSRNQPSVNLVGEPLDYFIRDSFCNTLKLKNILKKKDIYDQKFSYYGDQNRPPDIIIRNSDAVEVKKIGLGATEIQLNSSYPKSKLRVDCDLITQGCVNCEPGWKEKDMIYAIGHVSDDKVRLLTFVYGDCYAANTDLYAKLKKKIVDEVKSINLPFSETNEIGRLNQIDPLKITNLRIRGMWIIKTPLELFSDFIKKDSSKKLVVYCILRKEKYLSFPKEDIKMLEKEMKIENIKIDNPDNPKKKIDAILISFSF